MRRAVPLLLLLFACEGTITEVDPPESCQDESCIPRNPFVPENPLDDPLADSDVGVRPITELQFRNMTLSRLRLVAGDALWPVSVRAEELGAAGLYEELPGPTERAQLPIPFSEWAPVLTAMAKHVTDNDGRLNTMFEGGCITDDDASNDAQCIRDFFTNWGPVFWRRPAPQDDVDEFVGLYADPEVPFDRARARQFMLAVLTSPYALLIVEHGEQSSDSEEVAQLTDYELASRLALTIWQDAPDEQLLDEAAAGTLRQNLARQVARLLDDSRSLLFFRELAQDWLHIERDTIRFSRVQGLIQFLYANNMAYLRNASNEVIRDEMGGLRRANDSLERLRYFEELDAAMLEELGQYLRLIALDEDATFADVFTREVAPTTDERLAGIYGSEVWDGESAAPAHPSGRGGILGRAAFVASATASTRPIVRGARIWLNVLCRDFGGLEIPDNTLFTPPPNGDYTTRELVENSTEQPGCETCHAELNQVAFPLEHLGSLGSWRDVERFVEVPSFTTTIVVGGTSRGEEVVGLEDRWLPIDASGMPGIDPGNRVAVNGALELGQAIAAYQSEDSKDAYGCFTRSLLRFALDGGVATEEQLAAFEGTLRTESLRSMLIDFFTSDAFQTRDFGEETDQ